MKRAAKMISCCYSAFHQIIPCSNLVRVGDNTAPLTINKWIATAGGWVRYNLVIVCLVNILLKRDTTHIPLIAGN